MFCHFWQKFKKAAIFGEGKIFSKLPKVHLLDTLWVKNFDKIALSGTVKEIEAILCFSIVGKNSKWLPFLRRGKFFQNWQEYTSYIPCGSKISTKSLYLARLRRYKQFCVLPFLAKIQNGRHFWGGENFLKIGKNTFLRYPVGRRNRSISHG